MAKKIFEFFKGLIIICLGVAIIFGAIYIVCKYVIKDTTLIDGVGQFLFKKQNDVYVELKDENFKSEVERAKCYHYLQLDENAKTIYIVLENNIENFKLGKEEIKLPNKLSILLEKDNGQVILQQAFQDAWDAFSKDKPELFYFDGNKFCLITKGTKNLGSTKYEVSIGKGENQTYYSDGFKSKEQVDLAIQEYENKKKEISQLITIENEEYTYSYEKILKVHDWLVDNVSYDSNMQRNNSSNTYGAFVEKQAICEGYAEAFKCMMDELEVPCVVVCGISKDSGTGKEEKHAWNYVYIGNKWYAVDVTWDDPVINSTSGNKTKTSKALKYKYFLKGLDTMQGDHVATGEVVDGGKKFEYPEISKEDFK